MKKLNYFIAIVYFSVPSLAVANFSGHWMATSGKVSSNVGLSSDCSKVEIIIEQSETELLTKKYEATCKLFGSSWGPVREDLNGNQVLENGEVIGSITEDTLLTMTHDGPAAYAYNLKLEKNNNGELILKSYYGVKNSVGAIVTEATLKKVSN